MSILLIFRRGIGELSWRLGLWGLAGYGTEVRDRESRVRDEVKSGLPVFFQAVWNACYARFSSLYVESEQECKCTQA